jgi:branched-chain amino acid transport system substrate-binding protein
MRVRAIVAACAVLALGGCSPGDIDDEAQGGTLTVYVSAPLRGTSGEWGRAIVDGAKLALADAGGEAADLDVEAISMDDTSGDGEDPRWDPVVVADNARRATQDSTAIAYIGELESGATRASLPITNQAMMLHVSAGSTAVDLTRATPGSDDIPELVQPTGERTFGRVIPDDEKQAGAGAMWADELDVRSAAIEDDGSEFGGVVGSEFAEEAEALGIGIGGGGELSYLAGESPRLLGSSGELMSTDAFFGVPGLPAGLRLTSSAQAPEQLPAAGRDFAREYEREFGQPPDRYAAYGYEAMAVVLDSIERAADPRDRSLVIDAFFETADRDSVLGTYSIDELGDTTLDAISGYVVEDGEPVFDRPLEAP